MIELSNGFFIFEMFIFLLYLAYIFNSILIDMIVMYGGLNIVLIL